MTFNVIRAFENILFIYWSFENYQFIYFWTAKNNDFNTNPNLLCLIFSIQYFSNRCIHFRIGSENYSVYVSLHITSKSFFHFKDMNFFLFQGHGQKPFLLAGEMLIGRNHLWKALNITPYQKPFSFLWIVLILYIQYIEKSYYSMNVKRIK